MTLLRIDGFDHQNNSNDLISDSGAFVWRSFNGSVAGPGLGGIGKLLSFGNGGELYGVLTTPIEETFFGLAMYIPPSVNANAFLIMLWNSVTQNPYTTPTGQASVVFDSANGSISLCSGVPGQSGFTVLATTGNNVFVNGASFYFELHAKIASSGGILTANINGSQVATFSGTTEKDGNNIFDSIGFGGTGFAGVQSGCAIDHFYICDAGGSSPWNTFVGPIEIFTLFPTGAGASTQYTPLSGTNYSQVQETAMDSDTTYNFDSTVGHSDLFTIQSLPANVTPLAVQTTGAYRQDSGGTREVSNLIDSSGSVSAGTAVVLSTTYVYQHDVWITNGASAWTNGTVNSAQIGYETEA